MNCGTLCFIALVAVLIGGFLKKYGLLPVVILASRVRVMWSVLLWVLDLGFERNRCSGIFVCLYLGFLKKVGVVSVC